MKRSRPPPRPARMSPAERDQSGGARARGDGAPIVGLRMNASKRNAQVPGGQPMRRTSKAHLIALLGASLLPLAAPLSPALAQETPATVEPLNRQPWMNVFRRYDADDQVMFDFYEKAVGLERLGSFSDVGAGGVHRF